jgi:hypothetical protein
LAKVGFQKARFFFELFQATLQLCQIHLRSFQLFKKNKICDLEHFKNEFFPNIKKRYVNMAE